MFDFSRRLAELKHSNLKRTIQTCEIRGTHVVKGGKKLLSFCSNDYFGLSQDKRVIEASVSATRKYGAGAGASRLISGNNPLYDELEALLAKEKGTEAACVFGSGYLTNIGILGSLIGKKDLVLIDRNVHASIYAGIKYDYKRFKHNNTEDLVHILEKNRSLYENCIIVTETVFSMDGDLAPVDELYSIAKKYDALLMTDDAHGFGITKSCSADIHVGTLSKAIGCYGGFVCASEDLIDYIKTSASSLIYSTALPPSVLASAIESIKIISTNHDLCKKPLQKAKLFTKFLNMDKAASAIVPVIIGDEANALAASKKLEDGGFLVTAIRPPTVQRGTSRLRFTFSACHDDNDIKRLAYLCKKL